MKIHRRRASPRAAIICPRSRWGSARTRTARWSDRRLRRPPRPRPPRSHPCRRRHPPPRDRPSSTAVAREAARQGAGMGLLTTGSRWSSTRIRQRWSTPSRRTSWPSCRSLRGCAAPRRTGMGSPLLPPSGQSESPPPWTIPRTIRTNSRSPYPTRRIHPRWSPTRTSPSTASATAKWSIHPFHRRWSSTALLRTRTCQVSRCSTRVLPRTFYDRTSPTFTVITAIDYFSARASGAHSRRLRAWRWWWWWMSFVNAEVKA